MDDSQTMCTSNPLLRPGRRYPNVGSTPISRTELWRKEYGTCRNRLANSSFTQSQYGCRPLKSIYGRMPCKTPTIDATAYQTGRTGHLQSNNLAESQSPLVSPIITPFSVRSTPSLTKFKDKDDSPSGSPYPGSVLT